MIINPYIYSVGTSYDPDAQLFITATGISGTNATATNQLVLDLKSANIWTKMKAVYPMVGGTSTTCKFNLKDARDLDAAFRLTFSGGGTFSSNGYQPGGVNGYANTWFMCSVNSTSSNISAGVYSRTNSIGTGASFGAVTNAGEGTSINIKYTDNNTYYSANNFASNGGGNFVSDTRGLFIVNKFGATTTKLYKNGLTIATATPTTGNVAPAAYVFLGARAVIPSIVDSYDNRENAFSFIGNTLTDLESQLLYQITEKYQVALSRNINTTQSFYYNSAYNNETNAFLFSTQITDATIQTATNTLVSDLKTANIFTKMKALYPMVGGTATTHKYNLINPQDTNAAYRLAFVGGWTHSANGALPNGTNAYANTFLIPSSAGLGQNSTHISYYSKTNNDVGVDIGSTTFSSTGRLYLYAKISNTFGGRNNNNTASEPSISNLNGLGYYINNRIDASNIKLVKNGITTTSALASTGVDTVQVVIGAVLGLSSIYTYGAKQCAFASIGDGLSDAEALSYYNAVQTFNTTLGRQV